jgi:hypothetical protein
MRGVPRSFRVLAAAILLATAATGCGDAGDRLRDRVAEAVKTGKPLDLRDVSEHRWDRLYAFSPYTPGTAINAALGFRWEDADLRAPDRNDDSELWVFVRSARVVDWLTNDVIDGGCLRRKGGLPVTDAVVRVVVIDGGRFAVPKHSQSCKLPY